MQLTYDEVIKLLGIKFIPTKRTSFSLNPGIYDLIDLNNTLKFILPDNVKISVTKDHFRLETKLRNNQTLIFTDKTFFYTTLGFPRSHSYPLDNIDGFYQSTAGSYKSENPISFTGIDKVHLKTDCIIGNKVNCIREPILLSFGFSSPPGHRTFKEPKVKLFKKVNKSGQSVLNFLKDDDH